MRRRHVLALVVLALVVATVLAVGPMRVWDAVTLRTVETYWPNGQIRRRYTASWFEGTNHRLERWLEDQARDGWIGDDPALAVRGNYDDWYSSGQKRIQVRTQPRAMRKAWSEAGRLLSCVAFPDSGPKGVSSFLDPDTGEVLSQSRWNGGFRPVAERTAPPWFTEEEILRAVEGVEE